MTTISLKCPVPDCDYSTEVASEAIVIALLTAHTTIHTHPQGPSISEPRAARGPKLDRPKVDVGISAEEWNVFERRWAVFLRGSEIDNHSAPLQLFQCAGDSLSSALLKMEPNIANTNLNELLQMMRSLAVIPVATGVLRSELISMQQKREEPFRSFCARVRGKAETCSYTASHHCRCGLQTQFDFTDHMIRDVLVAGIYDTDIRREVLGTDNIINKPINDVKE